MAPAHELAANLRQRDLLRVEVIDAFNERIEASASLKRLRPWRDGYERCRDLALSRLQARERVGA